MKTEWDITGGGAHVVKGVEAVVDFIPTNRWLKRVNLPGRAAFMSLSCSRGRAPRTGHEERSQEPLRFYVQIKDEEDLAMLVIPPKFMEVMKEWLPVRLSHVIEISANKWCKLSVEVQNCGGGGRWCLAGAGITSAAHRIVPGNLVVLRISGLGLKVQIYNRDSSIRCRVRCSRHNCIGDLAFAL